MGAEKKVGTAGNVATDIRCLVIIKSYLKNMVKPLPCFRRASVATDKQKKESLRIS